MEKEIGSRGWWASCQGSRPHDRRNAQAFTWWLFAWMATFVGASMALSRNLVPPGWATYMVALFPNLLGAWAVFAYVKYIREADELLRKIQMEGLAWGFGAGWLFMVGYRLLERAGAPKLDISDGLMVMAVVYSVAIVAAARRYT